MSTEHSNLEHAGEHQETMSKGRIWKVFFILLAITVVEFIIALAPIPESLLPDSLKNLIYVVLTLVKAFYIVAFFMHLKFEKYSLIVGITVSFIFIIFFIILMLTEGDYMNSHMNI